MEALLLRRLCPSARWINFPELAVLLVTATSEQPKWFTPAEKGSSEEVVELARVAVWQRLWELLSQIDSRTRNRRANRRMGRG